MKNFQGSYLYIFLISILLLISCSRKKDKFINRNWHALNTKYNTLYNGEVSFLEGKQNLVENYEDNYWKQLPIERLEIRDEVYLQSQVENKSFARAEEKAAKAIQKHSMDIGGQERNPQIDEAFMLLGKARYFDQRFIQALEAFNYILYKYPTSNSINLAQIWKAKTHIRLDNNEGAIKHLKPLLKENRLGITKQEKADAAAMLAQAFVNIKQRDSAIEPMKLAIKNTQINEEKGRYHYILGQLYNKIRERDSANLEFDKIIKLNRRIPREYLINAYLAKARNLEVQSNDQIAFLDILNKLEENWENRPFLDKIYYEKAIFFFGIDSIDIAAEYYEKSLRTDTKDKYLRSLNYETLGRIKFNKGIYESAGAYMDSTLVLLDENSKRYRVIKRKRDNLDDVILYEGIKRTNDSILTLASMTQTDQYAYFKKITDSLRAQKEKDIKRQKAIKAKSLLNNPTFQNRVQNGIAQTDQKTFYFYNPITLENGKLQFNAIYGKRQLIDNWNVASLNKFVDVAAPLEEIEDGYDIDADPIFNPQLYVDKIPTDKNVLDSLKTQLNEAYFELGLVYKEQLTEYDKAADNFEILLENNPPQKLIMPAKYNLFKIYQAIGNFIREDKWKNDIIENHPNSRYAKIVKDPSKKAVNDGSSIEEIYTKIYRDYANQNYTKALNALEKSIKQYDGDPEVAKFQLLKALTIGKTQGVSKMKDLLNYIALTYPKADEGIKAQEILDKNIPYLEKMSFKKDTAGVKNYKIIVNYSSEKKNEAQILKAKLDTLIKYRNFNYLKTSVDFYSEDTLFVAIHGLKGKGQASGMKSILKDSVKSFQLTNRDALSVSSENYRVIQAKKNFNVYLKKRDSIYYAN